MAVLNTLMMTASGSGDTCEALEGELWCWGHDTDIGQMMQGVINTDRSAPIQVGTLTNWTNKFDIGGQSATPHMIKTDGTLWAWGRNTDGNLGDGTVINKSSPIQIGSLTSWSKVAAGPDFSFGGTT